MDDKKRNAKSIRMTDTVYHYINSHKGDGFNNKFHNIILEARNSERERREKLAFLDDKITKKEAELKELQEEIKAYQDFIRYTKVSCSNKLSKILLELEDYTNKMHID